MKVLSRVISAVVAAAAAASLCTTAVFAEAQDRDITIGLNNQVADQWICLGSVDFTNLQSLTITTTTNNANGGVTESGSFEWNLCASDELAKNCGDSITRDQYNSIFTAAGDANVLMAWSSKGGPMGEETTQLTIPQGKTGTQYIYCWFGNYKEIDSVSFVKFTAEYSDGSVSTYEDLASLLSGSWSGTGTLADNITVTSGTEIKSNCTVDGNGKTITGTVDGNGAMLYQNANVTSLFKNVTIAGNTKGDVGLWFGNGKTTIENATIKGFDITSGRYAAVAAGDANGGRGNLTLTNVKFENNSNYDIDITNNAAVTINAGTTLGKLRLQTNTCTLNIGDGWDGDFTITMDESIAGARTLGTVGNGANISGITVTNDGYTIVNDNGALKIIESNLKATAEAVTAQGTGEYAKQYAGGLVVTVNGTGTFKAMDVSATVNGDAKSATVNTGTVTLNGGEAVYGLIIDNVFEEEPTIANGSVTIK